MASWLSFAFFFPYRALAKLSRAAAIIVETVALPHDTSYVAVGGLAKCVLTPPGWLSFAFFFPYRALAKLSHISNA